MKKTKAILILLLFLLVIVALPNVAKGMEDTFSGWSVPSDDHGLPDGTISDVIEKIVNWLLAILGILGVAGFVVSGVMYITAAGDKDAVDRAKNIMTYSIIGVVVGLLGLVAVNTISDVLLW